MNQTIKLFIIGLKQILLDGILFALLPAPLFVGILFKLGIPFINTIMETQFSFSLVPWYSLVDGLLICLTPMLTGMISAFLILEERDSGVNAFYQITPAAGFPYITARLGIPMIWALLMTIAAAFIFGIAGLSAVKIICASIVSTLNGMLLAVMLTKLAENRVEGLALSKLAGISLLGLSTVWFIPVPYNFFAAFLPSFWIGIIIR